MTSQLSGSLKKKDSGKHSRKKQKQDVDCPGSSDEMFLITPDEGQATQRQEGHRKKTKKRKFSRETSPSPIDNSWVTTESDFNCEAEISSSSPKKKKKKLDKQGSEDETWSQPPPVKDHQLCPNDNQENGDCAYDYTPSHKKKKRKRKGEKDFGDPKKCMEEKAEPPSAIKDTTDTQLGLFASSPPGKDSQLCPNDNQEDGGCVYDYTPSHKKKKRKKKGEKDFGDPKKCMEEKAEPPSAIKDTTDTQLGLFASSPPGKDSQLCPNDNQEDGGCVYDYTPSHKKKKRKKKGEKDFGDPNKCIEEKLEPPSAIKDTTDTQLGLFVSSPPEKDSQLCPNDNQENGGCVYDYTPSHKKKKRKRKGEKDFGDPNKCMEEKAEPPSAIKDTTDTQLDLFASSPPEKDSQLRPNDNQENGGCVYDYTPSHKKKKRKRKGEKDFGDPNKCIEEKLEPQSAIKDYSSDTIDTQMDLFASSPPGKDTQVCPNNQENGGTLSHKKKKKKRKQVKDFGDPNKCMEEKAEPPCSIKDATDTQLDPFVSSPRSTTDTQKKEKTQKKGKSQKSSRSLRADDSDVTELDLEMESTVSSTVGQKRKQRNSVLKSAASKSHARRSQPPISATADSTCPSDSEHPPPDTDESGLESAALNADPLETIITELTEYIPHVRSLSRVAIERLAVRDLARFRRFKKKGIAVKFGVYSKKENALVKRNIERFLDISGIETAEKVLFPHRFPEEQADIRRRKKQYFFCDRIGKGIARPWRLIYYRARKLLDPQNYNGRYSKKEKKKLQKYYALYGSNWKKISERMNRSSHSIALKIGQMTQEADCKSGPWAEDELQRLLETLKDILRSKVKCLDSASGECDSDETLVLQREDLYKDIGWMKVASKVKTRCWRQCKNKWISILTKKMMGRENLRSGIRNLQFKIALIERLYKLNIQDITEINWESVSAVIGNVPPTYVQERFYALKTCVPFWNEKEFPEIIDHLFEVMLPKLKATLKKMAVSHGKKKRIKPKMTFRFTDIFNDNPGDDEEIHLEKDSG